MTIRRLLIGTTMLLGLSVWAWSRPCAEPCQVQARGADPVYAVEHAADVPHDGGNQDEAIARFRSGQARHWRQVVIGKH